MIQRRSLASITDAVRRQRGIFFSILIIGFLIAGLAMAKIHTKYTAGSTLLMVAEPINASELNPTTPTRPIISTDLPTLATSTTVLERLKSDLNLSDPIDMIAGNIHAKVSFDSTIMPVQYTSRDPEVAIHGANALAMEITRYYREIVTTRFDSLINDLNGQLQARRSDLARLDGMLDASARAYPYIDVQNQTSTQGSIYQRLIDLSTQRDNFAAQVKGDEAEAGATQALLANAKPLAERDALDNDSVYRNVHDQYAKDLGELQHIEAYGNSSYPGLAELRDIVAREAAGVAKARETAEANNPSRSSAYASALDSQVKAQAQLQSDQAKLAATNANLNQLHAQIGSGNVANDVSRIRRDRDNAETAYTALARRMSEAVADRAQAASVGSVIVIDHASFAKPSTFTSGKFIGLALIVLTIWLAITAAVLIDADRHVILGGPGTNGTAGRTEELAFFKES